MDTNDHAEPIRPRLYNEISREELYRSAERDTRRRRTLSFYRYVGIEDPEAFRDRLYADLSALDVLGRVYVSREGVNAQISVPSENADALEASIDLSPELRGVRLNWAIEESRFSFVMLKVRVRDRIVADGITDPSFDVTASGDHLSAAEFNELALRPETTVVDMRNHYESEVGHFKGAVLPPVDTFRESLPVVEKLLATKKDQPVVMYCTGGIRCEKASAWLKHRGFTKVFQLDGGIIEYARQATEQGLENRFIGKNFVFDERLGERITDDVIAHCHQCGAPCDDHTNCANDACHLLFIQCRECAATMEGCCSEECRSFIHLPIEEQRSLRKGRTVARPNHHKSRSRHS
ncbi:MAG: rhodanese-related sulfurtransferase [Spirochaetales bacterium]